VARDFRLWLFLPPNKYIHLHDLLNFQNKCDVFPSKTLHTVSCHIADLLPHLWKTSDMLCLSVLDMSVTVGPADSSCPAASSRAVGAHRNQPGPPQEFERLACNLFVFAA